MAPIRMPSPGRVLTPPELPPSPAGPHTARSYLAVMTGDEPTKAGGNRKAAEVAVADPIPELDVKPSKGARAY